MPRLPFRRSAKAADAPVLPDVGAADERIRPPLIVLTPLASGVTSFYVHHFADARVAQHYVQSIYESQMGLPRGIIAFWALQNPPANIGEELEPVVLVRSPDREAIACPYFFTDAAAGQSYTWTKLEQGVAPDSVSIYLALMVHITLDQQGAIALSPAHPPLFPRSRHASAGDDLGSEADGELATERHALPVSEGLPRRI